MAAKYAPTVTDTDQTVTKRGHAFPAKVVTCDCSACAVLVPAATVEAQGTKLALHNYVAQARVLGFPAA